MGAKNKKPKIARKNKREKFLESLRSPQPNPTNETEKKELEYIKIASTHPLDYYEFISQANRGTKFQNLEQHERFLRLIRKYEQYASMCMDKTDLRGTDLRTFAIKEMLNDEKCELSLTDRKILEHYLPKEIER